MSRSRLDWGRAKRNPRGSEAASPRAPRGSRAASSRAHHQRRQISKTVRVARAQYIAHALQGAGFPARVWMEGATVRVYVALSGRDVAYVTLRPMETTTWFHSSITDAQRAEMKAIMEGAA